MRVLTAAGLAPNEAAVYLSALSLGASSALQLARASNLKRTTVYSVVESLQAKGLMTLEAHGFKRLFAAEGPERLESLLDERRQAFLSVLPELSGLFKLKGAATFIKYYQGLEGMKAVYESLLNDVRPGEDYLIVSNPNQWMKLAEDFFRDFLERRARLPIRIRGLFERGPVSSKLKQLEKRYNQHIRFLPAETSLSTNLVVIPKKVVIHQLSAPVMAYVIENQSVVKMHREIFEIMWRNAEERSP